MGRWDQIWVSEISELILLQARHAETGFKKKRLRVLLRIQLKIDASLTVQHLKCGLDPAVSFLWLGAAPSLLYHNT